MTGRRDSSDTQAFEEDVARNEAADVEETVRLSKRQHMLQLIRSTVNDVSGGPERRPSVSRQQLHAHRGSWVVVNGMTFDLAPFLDGRVRHPGGCRILHKQLAEGQDAEERFLRWHHPSGNAVRMLGSYYKGDVEGMRVSAGEEDRVRAEGGESRAKKKKKKKKRKRVVAEEDPAENREACCCTCS